MTVRILFDSLHPTNVGQKRIHLKTAQEDLIPQGSHHLMGKYKLTSNVLHMRRIPGLIYTRVEICYGS